MTTASRALAATIAALVIAHAPIASAAESDAQAFEQQMLDAITASGVWMPGTTVTRTYGYPATPANILEQSIVNPDGSMSFRLTTSVSSVEVTCPQMGTCWERAFGKYVDNLWHALPAASIELFDGPHDDPFGFPFEIGGATYDISPVASGGTRFTMVDPGQQPGHGAVTYEVTVTDRRLDYQVFTSGRMSLASRTVYQSSPQLQPVSAPRAEDIGRPGSWTAIPYVVALRNPPG